MTKITIEEVTQYVDDHIGEFHDAKLKQIKSQTLETLLERKNPYLFKTKNILTSEEFIKSALEAHVSSQEETMFGNFLEKLAIFVCERTYGGQKSGSKGIDLDFNRDGKRYVVSIKSGPNWGNSRQIKKMRDDFKSVKLIIGSDKVVAINGCCYGRYLNEDQGDYILKCGQSFWEFISGDPEFYKHIIEPLGHRAKERNEEFLEEYSSLINRLSKRFTDNFCMPDGKIDWNKLVEYNSGIKRTEIPKLPKMKMKKKNPTFKS
jgi:hypothetical protein